MRKLVMIICGMATLAITASCSTAKTETVANDEVLLDSIQKMHLNYMWDGAEPVSGLACERIHLDGDYPENDQDVVTTGGSGFGIAGLLVGIERGFIPRSEGLKRLHQYLPKCQTALTLPESQKQHLHSHCLRVLRLLKLLRVQKIQKNPWSLYPLWFPWSLRFLRVLMVLPVPGSHGFRRRSGSAESQTQVPPILFFSYIHLPRMSDHS